MMTEITALGPCLTSTPRGGTIWKRKKGKGGSMVKSEKKLQEPPDQCLFTRESTEVLPVSVRKPGLRREERKSTVT